MGRHVLNGVDYSSSGASNKATDIAYTELDGSVTSVQNKIGNTLVAPDGTEFYFDTQDGVPGWNSDKERGADTFHPFKSGGGESVNAVVLLGYCNEANDEKYQLLVPLISTLPFNTDYISSEDGRLYTVKKDTKLDIAVKYQNSGGQSGGASNLEFRINDEVIDTVTTSDRDVTERIYKMDAKAGDTFGFYKRGTSGWLTSKYVSVSANVDGGSAKVEPGTYIYGVDVITDLMEVE